MVGSIPMCLHYEEKKTNCHLKHKVSTVSTLCFNADVVILLLFVGASGGLSAAGRELMGKSPTARPGERYGGVGTVRLQVFLFP